MDVLSLTKAFCFPFHRLKKTNIKEKNNDTK